MRKTRPFLAAVILLLCPTVAVQAQRAIWTLSTNTPEVREGGKAEAVGHVLLSAEGDTGAMDAVMNSMITLRYSAPIAMATMVTFPQSGSRTVADAAITIDHESGLITFDSLEPGENETYLIVQGVLLDLEGKSGMVTVTATARVAAGVEDSFVAITGQNTSNVGEIKAPITAGATKVTLRTRGGVSMAATFTVKEGFASAFTGKNGGTGDTMLRLQVAGVPEKATVTVSPDLKGSTLGMKKMLDDADAEAPYTGMIVVDPDGATASTGKALNFDITLMGATVTRTETVMLTLVLDASTDVKGLELPLEASSITAQVTMRPQDKPTTAPHAYFVENYLPDPAPAVFMIAPAQCKMLFPLVFSLSTSVSTYETGISIANPNGSLEESDGAMDGSITFTLFPNMGDPFEYSTSAMSPGQGLMDGILPAGKTYIVTSKELLYAAGWMDSFQGHMHVLTDFIDCQGLAIMYDGGEIGQSYLPIILDKDTGK